MRALILVCLLVALCQARVISVQGKGYSKVTSRDIFPPHTREVKPPQDKDIFPPHTREVKKEDILPPHSQIPQATRKLPRIKNVIPPRIPTTAVVAESTYSVPLWLGAFDAVTPVFSNWSLPLTYANGGKTYPGQFLMVNNQGPFCILLSPSLPETIEGESGLLIGANQTAIVMSNAPDWVLVSLSVLPANSYCCVGDAC